MSSIRKIITITLLILIAIQLTTPILAQASNQNRKIGTPEKPPKTIKQPKENRTLITPLQEEDEELIKSTPTMRKVIVMSKECEIGLVKPSPDGTIVKIVNLNGSYLRHKEEEGHYYYLEDLSKLIISDYNVTLNDSTTYYDRRFWLATAASSNLNKDGQDELFTIHARMKWVGDDQVVVHGPVIYWNLTAEDISSYRAGIMNSSGLPTHALSWPCNWFLWPLNSHLDNLKLLIGDINGDHHQDYGVLREIYEPYNLPRPEDWSGWWHWTIIWRHPDSYLFTLNPQYLRETPTGSFDVQLANPQHPILLPEAYSFLVDINHDGVKEIAIIDSLNPIESWTLETPWTLHHYNYHIYFYKLNRSSRRLKFMGEYTIDGPLSAPPFPLLLGADAGDLDRDGVEEIVLLYAIQYPVYLNLRLSIGSLFGEYTRLYPYIYDMAYQIDIIDPTNVHDDTLHPIMRYFLYPSSFSIPRNQLEAAERRELFYEREYDYTKLRWYSQIKVGAPYFTFVYHDFICHPIRGSKLIVEDVDGDGYDDIVVFYEDRVIQVEKLIRCKITSGPSANPI